jgi:membrane peptidoglycan carboxypeptidase
MDRVRPAARRRGPGSRAPRHVTVVVAASPLVSLAPASGSARGGRVPGLPVHRADLRLGAEAGDEDLRPRRQAHRRAVRGAAHAHRDRTLPPHVPQAFIAVEDKRFYRTAASTTGGSSREPAQRVSRRITGGGSTITQQLARNMFEEGIGFEQRRRATRKLKEARVAQQIEEVYTKDEILQAYINQVNYGHGWRGIETASQHYFGKAAVELNPAEAAMLAAAVNAPGRFSPFINPDATLRGATSCWR